MCRLLGFRQVKVSNSVNIDNLSKIQHSETMCTVKSGLCVYYVSAWRVFEHKTEKFLWRFGFRSNPCCVCASKAFGPKTQMMIVE